MVKNCAIIGCKNTQYKKKQYSFFRFPKNKYYREEWLKVCSKKIGSIDSARVCSAHFLPDSFKSRDGSQNYVDEILKRTPLKRLCHDAVPTENLFSENEKSNQNSRSDATDYEVSDMCSLKISKDVSIDDYCSETTSVSTSNDTEEEGSLGTSDDFLVILDTFFSSLLECDFTSEENNLFYLERLQQIKQEINEKITKLRNDIEKEKREKEKKEEEIEKLRKERREQCDAFLIKFLELKKSEAFWKKECLSYKIKQYCAANKLSI